MFYIINSMSLVEYILLMVVTIIILIIGRITLKESQKTWKWACYIGIITCCFIIAQRLVSEYMPGTVLAEVCHILMLIGLPIFVVSVFIVGYFANKNQKK